MRFFAPTASPRTKQRPEWYGLPRRTACALRFSQPLDASIRPVPAGLVSCQIRSWGCSLQSFAPLAQPFAVSGAVALLSLDTPDSPPAACIVAPKRTEADNAPTSRPAPKRLSIGRCPARPNRPPKRPSRTARARNPTRDRRNGPHRIRSPRADPFDRNRRGASRARMVPGSTLAFRALLHAKIHVPEVGGLDRPQVCSSPGIHTLQGSLPRRDGTTFTAPPLMGFPSGTRTSLPAALQGFTPGRIGWSPRRLPTLMGFAAF
jgi:hypothetical protein